MTAGHRGECAGYTTLLKQFILALVLLVAASGDRFTAAAVAPRTIPPPHVQSSLDQITHYQQHQEQRSDRRQPLLADVSDDPVIPDPNVIPPGCDATFSSIPLPLTMAVQQVFQVSSPNSSIPESYVYANLTMSPLVYRSNTNTYLVDLWMSGPYDSMGLGISFNATCQNASVGAYVYESGQQNGGDEPPFWNSIGSCVVPENSTSSPIIYTPHMVTFLFDGYESPPFAQTSFQVPTIIQFASPFEACMITILTTIHCCSEPLPPVTIEQPYGMLILSTFAYFIFSYAWVFCMMRLERWSWWQRNVRGCLCCRFRSNSKQCVSMGNHPSYQSSIDEGLMKGENNSPVDEEVDEKQPVLTFSERLARANTGYLIFQFLFVSGNFCYVTLLYSYLDHSPLDASYTSWFKYQYIYFTWANSSQATLLSSAIASYLLVKYQLYKSLESTNELPPFKSSRCCERCCSCCGCCTRIRKYWYQLKLFIQLTPNDRRTRNIALMVFFLQLPIFITNVLPVWLIWFPFFILTIVGVIILAVGIHLVLDHTQRVWNQNQSNQKHTHDPMNNGADTATNSNSHDTHAPSSKITLTASDDDHPTFESTAFGINDHSIKATSDSRVDSTKFTPGQRSLVTFPWYSVLLLRLICTIVIVLLLQTATNYGFYLWTQLEPQLQYDYSFATLSSYWYFTMSWEYNGRSVSQWTAGIEASLHQFMMQVTLFL